MLFYRMQSPFLQECLFGAIAEHHHLEKSRTDNFQAQFECLPVVDRERGAYESTKKYRGWDVWGHKGKPEQTFRLLGLLQKYKVEENDTELDGTLFASGLPGLPPPVSSLAIGVTSLSERDSEIITRRRFVLCDCHKSLESSESSARGSNHTDPTVHRHSCPSDFKALAHWISSALLLRRVLSLMAFCGHNTQHNTRVVLHRWDIKLWAVSLKLLNGSRLGLSGDTNDKADATFIGDPSGHDFAALLLNAILLKEDLQEMGVFGTFGAQYEETIVRLTTLCEDFYGA